MSACAVSAALISAAPASVESRGFTVTSNSNATLRLEGLNHVDCDVYILCPLGPQYAAQLTDKIEHTNAKLEIWIEITPTLNNSRCEVVPASAGRCTAGGLGITFTR